MIKLLFFYQEADEPPTKQGQPFYSIDFIKDAKGDLRATHYRRNKKKKKLQTPLLIERQYIDEFDKWRKENKKKFSLADLNLDVEIIKSAYEYDNASYKLHFGVPNEFSIKVDTFNFCQPYKIMHRMIIGGYNFSVSITNSLEKESKYHFDINDAGVGKLDLQRYIFFYKILQNAIPTDLFTKADLFFQRQRIFTVLYYLQMIECEGFFYKEFKNKNPQRTAQEHRMSIGWDFVEYMKQRQKEKQE